MEAVLNKPFNGAQIELIQILAQDLDTNELMELRKVLIAFRFRLVEERAERELLCFQCLPNPIIFGFF